VRAQNQRLWGARRDCSGIDEYIKKLESNPGLSETERRTPVTEVKMLFRNERGGKGESQRFCSRVLRTRGTPESLPHWRRSGAFWLPE
jgi:hypothetical protein